jgi:hypothetical protein
MPDRDYTPYQRKVIQRYYRNQDAMKGQRLQELVSDLYLATTPKKRDALWERARALLLQNGVPEAETERVVGARSVEALAEVVQRLAKGSE